MTDENDPISKANVLVAKALADADGTADLSLIPTRYIQEFAKTVGVAKGSLDGDAKLVGDLINALDD